MRRWPPTSSRPTPGDRWKVTRQRWAGSLLEDAWLDGEPRLLTVAAHAVPALEPAAGAAPAAVVAVTAAISDADLRAQVVGIESTGSDKVSLAEAKVVVGGGRGLGSAEAFAILDELAGLLGGAVGVSRVATSLGWRPHAQQVGPDRDADRPGPLHRVRDQRRHPAHRRLQVGQADPRHQHRPGRPDLQPRRLRGHRRRPPGRPGDQRGDPPNERGA